MVFPLSLKTFLEANDGSTDHDAILLVASEPTSRARSRDSRKYPSPSYFDTGQGGLVARKSCRSPGSAARTKEKS
jgi:hypothetical protein